MVYQVIGIMSGSSLDGLDIAFANFQKNPDKWTFELVNAACRSYDKVWQDKLSSAHTLSALDYQLLDTEYGHYIGREVKHFIEENNLQYRVQLIASHGHTVFHLPAQLMTSQLGDGAAIAAETGINTVNNLRSMDIALGGQGAPIVPIGELLLFGNYDFYLNLGGIANLSYKSGEKLMAFDVCAANRVLNLLANESGKLYDQDGKTASAGMIDEELFGKLNELEYYEKPYPKSLANSFGTDLVIPLILRAGCSIQDGLRTYVEHIVIQIAHAIEKLLEHEPDSAGYRLLATGGGVHNLFLTSRLQEVLGPHRVSVIIPEKKVVDFKEALIMAFMGVLRWREEYTVMATVTGAVRSSIGGAVWIAMED